MAKERIETGKAPAIEITHCAGDLAVNGWPETAVVIKGEFTLEETEAGLRLSSHGDLRLSVPLQAQLSVAEVGGDMAVKEVTGACAAGAIHGDAILAGVGASEIASVHGDLVVRNATGPTSVHQVYGDVAARRSGDLRLDAVYGDCAARYVNGSVNIGEASGDVDLHIVLGDVNVMKTLRDANLAHVGGALNVAEALGDIRLRGGLGSGDHVLQATGDIVVRWPRGAAVNLIATARRIDNRLVFEDTSEKNGSLLGRIGESETSLALTAGGRIILREAELVAEQWESFGGEDMGFDVGVDFAGIGARIEAEIGQQMARVGRDLETKFGKDFSDRLAEKIARKTERAAERMERRAERVGERTRGRGFDFGGSAAASPAPRKSVSPDEQLKILKMVETGAITSEEAGMLLEALEG